MIDPKKAEIMAPAGSYESLAAAINAGADSVYFGVTQLNMRSRAADNFGLSDIKKIVEKCHRHGVLAYLVVNTLLYDHDVKIMRRIIDAAQDADVDAIIAFDFACVNYCNRVGIPVHMSVQFSISNYETVKFFAQFTNRVVLARELTVKQIKNIYERIRRENLIGNEGRPMEIEAFVHGALCVAQSGRCYMSLYTHNASANRGACRQNCRHRYKVIDMETGKELVLDNHYVMSAADICTVDFLDELLQAGVSVMKIEGRGRKPEYVDTVTRVYKRALCDIARGTYTAEAKRGYLEELKKVYNRGLSRGNYYLGRELGEYSDVYGSKAVKRKEFVGVVKHYFPKAGAAEVEIKSGELAVGDEYYFIGATTGVLSGCVRQLRDTNEKEIKVVRKGQTATLPVSDRVRVNDKLYKLVDNDPNE